MPGSHADNPQRLALIREGDALLIVLNGFSAGNPAAQLAAFRDEMLFADLGVVTTRLERLEASLKKPRPDRELVGKELEIVKSVRAILEEGKTVASLDLSAEDKKPLRSFGLLTDKPDVIVLNAVQGESVPDVLKAIAPHALAIDASWSSSWRNSSPRSVPRSWPTWVSVTWARIGSSAKRTMPSASSPSSPRVSRKFVAGTSSASATAVAAAGKIHTDLAKGFIRAEVTAYEDLHRRVRSRKPRPSICNGSKERNT